MEKINIAEVLKNCPSDMELDCTTWENVTFEKVVNDEIYIKRNNKTPSFDKIVILNKYGCCTNHQDEKCRIFPKGNNTWDGFVPPCQFKDGDIVADKKGNIAIYKQIHKSFEEPHIDFYCGLIHNCGLAHYNELFVIKNDEYQNWGKIKYIGFATEEEKQKLYDAIQDNGYKWNPETKTLEKLIKPVFKIGDKISLKGEDLYWDIKTIKGDWYICTNGAKIHIEEQHHYELVLVEPRFKVGDRIKCIYNNNQYDIKELTDTHYTLIEVKNKFKYTEPINEDKNWELVPNKFDINTLKTFDQVLVRLTNNCVWMPKFFYYYDTDSKGKYYPFVTIDNIGYPQCIPYNGNEHLCRKTNNCDEFYKTWND